MKKVLYLGSANLIYQQMEEVDTAIRELFEKTETEYVILPDEKHCVEGLYAFGFRKQALEEAELFHKQMKGLDVEAIVSPYGAGQNMWEKVYPKEFGLKLDVPFLNVTQFFNDALKERDDVKLSPVPMKLIMHDGCTLGRKLGLYNAPREALRRIPELELIDLEHPSIGIGGTTAADWSSCPGAWMNMSVPELATEVEVNFIEKNAMPLKADAITTTCANAYFGIRMGIQAGNFPLKAYFFTNILNMAWRV